AILHSGDEEPVAGRGSRPGGRCRSGRRSAGARGARPDQDRSRSRRPPRARIAELPEGRPVSPVARVPEPARRDQVGEPVSAEMEGQTPVAADAQTERLRVLLVDDNASVLRFLASAFASNNCQVTTAATAEQALEQLGDDPFDLVVSDIKMPGLSGLDLLRAVKGKQPSTPVV